MLDGEENLIQRAVKGRPSAFGQLYDHYQPMIYRFVFVKVGRREEAEDLTHQVFLSAWQNIRSYEHLGFPFSSWLYQIARNQVIDHYRTRKITVDIESVEADLVSPSDAEMLTERKIEREVVERAIRTLKPEYQDIILLRFVEDMSIKEVSLSLQKTEGAVKLMQYRAVKELKKVLSLE